ncbi:MAG TPA: hypothetical protein VGB88_00440 [Alphaproteobacteria bacterium]
MPSPVVLTVGANRLDARLSPFFGLAPWVMVVEPLVAAPVWVRNTGGNIAHVVDLIRAQAPALAICGHIPADAALLMVEAGIELRIGPCSVPATSLIPLAATLPTPNIAPMRSTRGPGSA